MWTLLASEFALKNIYVKVHVTCTFLQYSQRRLQLYPQRLLQDYDMLEDFFRRSGIGVVEVCWTGVNASGNSSTPAKSELVSPLEPESEHTLWMDHSNKDWGYSNQNCNLTAKMLIQLGSMSCSITTQQCSHRQITMHNGSYVSVDTTAKRWQDLIVYLQEDCIPSVSKETSVDIAHYISKVTPKNLPWSK